MNTMRRSNLLHDCLWISPLAAIFLVLISSSFTVSSEELFVWAKITFEEDGLAFENNNRLILPFPVMQNNPKAGTYLALRHYTIGAKSTLRPLAFAPGCENHGRAIKPDQFNGKDIAGGELVFLMDHIGEMPSAPDLTLAFKLFVPADDTNEYHVIFWNCTQEGKKATILLKPNRGKWNFIRVTLHVPQFIDKGDIVRNVSMKARSYNSKPFHWLVDDIVVWSGQDRIPPSPVEQILCQADGDDNLIRWTPVEDNLAIAAYEIHRGTVPLFQPTEKTVIGRTTDSNFRDVCPMHENSFYRIIAIDYADNPSTPSPSVQRMKK